MVSSKIGRDFDILRVGLYLYCRFLYDLEDPRGKNSVFEVFLVRYGAFRIILGTTCWVSRNHKTVCSFKRDSLGLSKIRTYLGG